MRFIGSKLSIRWRHIQCYLQALIRNEADESVFPYSGLKSATNPEEYGVHGSVNPYREGGTTHRFTSL